MKKQAQSDKGISKGTGNWEQGTTESKATGSRQTVHGSPFTVHGRKLDCVPLSL